MEGHLFVALNFGPESCIGAFVAPFRRDYLYAPRKSVLNEVGSGAGWQ